VLGLFPEVQYEEAQLDLLPEICWSVSPMH